MKNKRLQISLLLMATGLLFSSSLTAVFSFNSASEWELKVDGGVSNPLNLTIDDLVAMPSTSVTANIFCDGVPVEGGTWTGVNLMFLLYRTGVDPTQGQSITFLASDGYAVRFSISIALQDEVIIAYSLDGNPLPEMLRLVLPQMNGNNWISKITEITLSALDQTPSTINTGVADTPNAQTSPTQSPLPELSTTPQAQFSTSPPSSISKPENQSAASSFIPPSNDQTVQPQGSSDPSVPKEYAYPILSATIAVTAISYLLYKRRK